MPPTCCTEQKISALRDQSAAQIRAIEAKKAAISQQLTQVQSTLQDTTAKLDYSGHLDVYDGIICDVGPLPGDTGTAMVDTNTWTVDALETARLRGGAHSERGERAG